MFDLFGKNEDYMGAAVNDSLSLGGNETDPTKSQAEQYDLKTGKKKNPDSLGEQAIAKDLAKNNEAGQLAKGTSMDAAVDQELEDQASEERMSMIADGLGMIAMTAAGIAMAKNPQGRSNVRQSRVTASAPKGGSQSNLLSGGGVERYLKPISGGRKIQGYFR